MQLATSQGAKRCRRYWRFRRRCMQNFDWIQGCSLSKWCEGFDRFSRSTRRRQIIGCQTSAFLGSLNALIRALLPAGLAFAEEPCVHSANDAGARMSVVVGRRKNASFFVFRHDLLHPVGPLPVQDDGYWFWCIVHLLVAQSYGTTNS